VSLSLLVVFVHSLYCFNIAQQSGHMLDNVSTSTIAGRELGAMSTAMKTNLVATLDKSLNTSVNKVCLTFIVLL
jgi:hypothetical protein